MKISKEEASPLNSYTATINPFSKVDIKEPDSPPPKEEFSDDDDLKPGKPNKFERLM